MRIVVCVKQVLDPRGIAVNRKAEKIFINREEYILDPACKAALQVAAGIKAALTASNGATPPEIVALSIGPARADDALREAMGFGADRAILLADAAFEKADALVAATALAAAIRRIGPVDLILLGTRSLDTGSGEMASRLAETLDLPQVLEAVSIEAVPGRVTVVYRSGKSFFKTEVALPAVVSVVPEAFEAGLPDGWRLMDAYTRGVVATWGAADLGLANEDCRPMSAKKEDAVPPERQLGTKVRDSSEIITLLRRERLI